MSAQLVGRAYFAAQFIVVLRYVLFPHCGCLTYAVAKDEILIVTSVMRISKLLVYGFIAGLSLPNFAASETYAESFECVFGKGLVNRPTPTRVVFSVDESQRSIVLHEVEMQGINTPKTWASINRTSYRLLSFSWFGELYTFSENGRRTRVGDPRTKVLDIGRQEFSIFLNRQTMRAIASSRSNVQTSHDGNANGTCVEIEFSS
ncbi:hypothetical protein [Ruegeria lacuscaerulensis]|uniref:hypothetical protein n=1 Tax=Ruegeria lacuscaerulensis TaxID=55218 RepID=UPI00147EC668|nr:hypothetical protein [Ruegeria lacuscaerulensis]